ncbi:hypothetical protein NQ317_012381 [Molorchus minor]|uniref:Uncharacterized protein n=1 Tax=Molorchus minor TaxID=1323400 RepID=A0ABQ9IT76_9CUCU|nr:hypothetical protein NQ317_012381 [Molorchus minor]
MDDSGQKDTKKMCRHETRGKVLAKLLLLNLKLGVIMKDILGYEPDDLLEKSVYEYHHAMDSDSVCSAYKCHVGKFITRNLTTFYLSNVIAWTNLTINGVKWALSLTETHCTKDNY